MMGFTAFLFRALLSSTTNAYYFVLCFFVLCLVVMYLIYKSPFGMTLQAIRDNPARCSAVGINVRRHQLMGIVIATFFAGVAGVLFVILERSVFPDLLFWVLSLEIFIMCLLGGWFTFAGPVLGAAITVALRTFVGAYTEYWTLILGCLLIFMIFFLPEGVMGFFEQKFGGKEELEGDNMLRVEGVTKSFDKFLAVNGADLTVEKGQLVAVIGPNGAGKTTLFNLITGILKPDRGRIVFKGEDISKLPPHEICRRGIARSFQIANVFHRLTVFKNVQVSVLSQQGKSNNLVPAGSSMAVDETNRILESVGLLGKVDHIAGSLSHGDQRILEIAIALGNRPQMLILDEPTAGMSPEETSSTMCLIKRLADTQGLTILFCEHDMDVVFNTAQSIMVMHYGKTIIQGSPRR